MNLINNRLFDLTVIIVILYIILSDNILPITKKIFFTSLILGFIFALLNYMISFLKKIGYFKFRKQEGFRV